MTRSVNCNLVKISWLKARKKLVVVVKKAQCRRNMVMISTGVGGGSLQDRHGDINY